MSFLRRRLSWMLGAWLVFQVAGVVVPVALAAAGHVHEEDTCTCPAGGHSDSCPMHHRSDTSKSSKTPNCVLQNASSPVNVGLLSLAVGGGILPQTTSLDTSLGLASRVLESARHAISRADIPTAPPPRS